MKWILARSIKAKIAVSGALMAGALGAAAYLHLNSELTCQDFDLSFSRATELNAGTLELPEDYKEYRIQLTRPESKHMYYEPALVDLFMDSIRENPVLEHLEESQWYSVSQNKSTNPIKDACSSMERVKFCPA